MQWLSEFKRAVIEKEFEKISSLLKDLPNIKSKDEAKAVLALINEAKNYLLKEREQIRKQMQNIQKTKKFLDTKSSSYSLDMSY